MRYRVNAVTRMGIWLFDHLVSAYQDDARQSKVKQFRCPSIDYHLEDGGLLNWNVSGLSAFQYLVDKIGKAAPFTLEARAVAQQSTRVAELSEPEYRRQTLFRREPGELL